MANFFKDYQKNLRERQELNGSDNRQRNKQKNFAMRLDRGDMVTFKNGEKLFFSNYAGGDFVLLSENKANAKNGKGFIYDISDIAIPETISI